MSLSKKIEKWLAGPQDFEEGCELLASSGKRPALLLIFKRSGDTSYNSNKLREELQQLAKTKLQPSQASVKTNHSDDSLNRSQESPAAEATPKKAVSQKSVSQYDPHLLALIRERSHYHAQLTAVATEAQRMKLAFSILEITDRIEIMLGVKEVMPEAKPRTIPEDRAEMVKMLNNNRSYISRYRNSLSKAQGVNIRLKENEVILSEMNANG